MKYLLFLAVVLGLLSFALPSQIWAQTEETQQTEETKEQTPAGPTKLDNPLSVDSVPALIGKVINGILGVVGSLALLMFIYGGFTWMLSGGNSNAVERGKNILMWAAIGLVIIFMSYALVSFIIKTTTT